MKSILFAAAILIGAGLTTAAEAKGCIKGAIIGGIAGHYAGHGKIGAVAGCVIGRHEANKAAARGAGQNSRGRAPDDGRI